MLKPLYLKIHGWLAVIFAAPLAVLCVTGMILSLEPIIQYTSIEPGTLTSDEITHYLKKFDPEGKGRSLIHRPYENTLTIGGAGADGEIEIDLVTREPSVDDGSWSWSEVFRYNRRLHEHLTVAGLDLTIASTIAMLVVILIGILMGLPKIRNTVAGWHKAAAWFLLPLVVISPLTGLFLPLGWSMNPFNDGEPAGRTAALPLAEAVRIVGQSQDLSNIIWLRQRGGRQLVRLWDGQEARAFAVTAEGLKPAPRNISRIIHEGNFLGVWSGLLMLITAGALTLLTLTGVWLFGSKQVRKYQNRKARAQRATEAPAE